MGDLFGAIWRGWKFDCTHRTHSRGHIHKEHSSGRLASISIYMWIVARALTPAPGGMIVLAPVKVAVALM